jgi:hypothetical protein
MKLPLALLTLCACSLAHCQIQGVYIAPAGGKNVKALSAGVGDIVYAKIGGGFVLRPKAGLRAVDAAKLLQAKGLSAKLTTEAVPPPALRTAKGETPDYLENYNYWVKLRGYPYETPDPRQLRLGIKQRELMPAYHPGSNGPKVVAGNWQLMGPNNLPIPHKMYMGDSPINGRVSGAAIDRTNANIMYIAAACGGVWKTTDAGVNWNFLSQQWPDLHTSCVTIDPTNHLTIYVGTGDYFGDQRHVTSNPYGIQKSTDGGATWTTIGAPWLTDGKIVIKIWVNPANGLNLVVTTTSDIYRSLDGGTTWIRATNSNYNLATLDYSIARPLAPTHYLYAAGVDGATPSNGVILRSTNDGATWGVLPVPMPSNGKFYVAPSKLFPDTLYALDDNNHRVWKSVNAGGSWTNTTNDFLNGGVFVGGDYNWSQIGYDSCIATSSKAGNDVVYVGLIDVEKSTNGGNSWNSIGGATWDVVSSRIHNDQHSIAVDPSNPDNLLLLNDGGAYSYHESANSTTPLNARLSITQFFRADWDNAAADFAIGGTQDNATPWLDHGVWKNVGGGDGGGVAIDQTNNSVMFALVNGVVHKTDTSWFANGSQDISWMANEAKPSPFFLYFDPNDHTKLYATGQYVYRLNNVFLGGTDRLAGPNDTGGLSSIAVANGDSNRIYCGGPGNFWMSQNGGSTWTNIGGSSLMAYVTGISVNPSNENDVIVVLAGGNSQHVWHCANTTATTPVWFAISGAPGTATSLPDVAFNCVARDPFSPATFYVGSDIGVFMTIDSGVHWYNATGPLGLPNAPITAMKASGTTRFLNVATFGRGMWRLPLNNLAVHVSSFSASPLVVYEGNMTIGNITLSAPMPYPGDSVGILCANYSLASAPISVPVRAGAATATVPIRALHVTTSTSTTVTASYHGSTATATFTIRPPFILSVVGLQLRPYGGYLMHLRLTFVGIPQLGGAISLLSDNKAAAVPSTFKVNPQRLYVDVPVSTSPVDVDTQAKITATFNGRSTFGYVTIYAPEVNNVQSDAAKYASSSKGQLTVTLSSPAGPSGAKVTFSVKPTGVISMPASVVVPAGATQATVGFSTLKPSATTTVTVSATTVGFVGSASFDVNP